MKVAFYKGRNRLFDKAVQWWTRSPYSHCELVLNYLEGGLSECASSSNRDGGVRIKMIELLPERWDIVDIKGDDKVAMDWFTLNLGKKYDLLGLFGFVLPIKSKRSRWFCSEAVAESLGYTETWRYSPAILYSALARKLTN